jgi:putative membrane protein
MIVPRKATNVTTELAKERNRAAAERTLASWIRKCIGLIGFGAGFDSIFAGLHQAFPNSNPAISMRIAHIVGLTAIGLGVLILTLVTAIYQAEIRSLEREDYLSRPLSFSLTTMLLCTAIFYASIALFAVFFVLPWQ